MANRVINIEITGESGQYQATVQRIIEKNNQFNRAALQGAEQTTAAFGGLQRILINLPSFFGGIGRVSQAPLVPVLLSPLAKAS